MQGAQELLLAVQELLLARELLLASRELLLALLASRELLLAAQELLLAALFPPAQSDNRYVVAYSIASQIEYMSGNRHIPPIGLHRES